MKKLIAMVLSLVLILPALSLADTTEFSVDSVHSFVLFTVSNRGNGHVVGMFRDISGVVTADPVSGELLALNIMVKTESVFTKNEKRDNHLRSPDFFNAKQFPVMTFKSSTIERKDGNLFTVTGEMTIHGQTKTISFEAAYNGHNSQLNTVGGTAELKIKRSEYGMDFMVPNIGDEVTLQIILEARAK